MAAQATRGVADRQNSRPAAVRRFPTGGGTSASPLLATGPAPPRSAGRAASFFGLIGPSRLWSSVNRNKPWFARVPTISTDHFFATVFSTPSSRCGHMSPAERTRAHPGTTGKAAGRLSLREVTLRRLRGTDKYFPMVSGFDETQQEGAAGASVAAASGRKVPTLSAVKDLDSATNEQHRLAGVHGFQARVQTTSTSRRKTYEARGR